MIIKMIIVYILYVVDNEEDSDMITWSIRNKEIGNRMGLLWRGGGGGGCTEITTIKIKL